MFRAKNIIFVITSPSSKTLIQFKDKWQFKFNFIHFVLGISVKLHSWNNWLIKKFFSFYMLWFVQDIFGCSQKKSFFSLGNFICVEDFAKTNNKKLTELNKNVAC